MQSETLGFDGEPYVLGSKTIAITCSADDNYAMPLTVMLRSVVENLNHSCEAHIFIIDGGIKNHNKEKIVQSLNLGNCNVEFLAQPESLLEELKESGILDTKGQLKPAKTTSYVTTPGLFRLFLPQLLSQLDKVIYLDCDLIVRGDLSQLWEIDIKNYYLAAVQEFWIPYVSSEGGLPNYQELGLSKNTKYFNSGVLLINLQKWRTDNISFKLIDYRKRNIQHLQFCDQDVLNAVTAEQWKELDPLWNVTPGVYRLISRDSNLTEKDFQRLLQDPYVIHYASASKPWAMPQTGFKETQFKDYFFHYLDNTQWAGWRLTFWRLFIIKTKRKLKKINRKFKLLNIFF